MSIQTVGVVGAGVMGRGVAQALAQTGHQVILLDISDEILASAKKEIKGNIRVYNLFADKKLTISTAQILSNITFSTDYDLLANADFVVENATEKWEIKQPIYHKLDALCPEETILAVNTSAIPITRLAGLTKRPSKVLGMHFMNPVPLKPTVEVIRAYHTSEETLAQAYQLLAQMGKKGITVNDSSGFVTNRVMMLTVNEAVFLLQEQVASASEIDRLFEQCFGHKMGPLATADLIGLDTVLLSIEVLYENFNDSKYRPCPLLRKMVDAGLYGRKSGQGFYTYNNKRR